MKDPIVQTKGISQSYKEPSSENPFWTFRYTESNHDAVVLLEVRLLSCEVSGGG